MQSHRLFHSSAYRLSRDSTERSQQPNYHCTLTPVRADVHLYLQAAAVQGLPCGLSTTATAAADTLHDSRASRIKPRSCSHLSGSIIVLGGVQGWLIIEGVDCTWVTSTHATPFTASTQAAPCHYNHCCGHGIAPVQTAILCRRALQFIFLFPIDRRNGKHRGSFVLDRAGRR